MLNLLMQAHLQEIERRNHSGLPVNEYLEEAARQARQEHLEESRYVDAALRQWWLDEQGWLLDRKEPSRPFRPSVVERLCQSVGQIFISWGVWLTNRAKPVADLSP